MFSGKTVTNFASVRYDNNGGLNPVSPQKRGLAREAVTNSVKLNNTEWRNRSAIRSTAKPGLELDVEDRAVSVFQPKKIVSDNDESKRIFKKYSNFKNEFDPQASKAEYKHFLDRVVQDKRHYDSNISNSLNYQKKFLAYKRKELAQRAAALHGNIQQDQVHKSVTDSAMLKMEMEKAGLVRVQPDQYNYRSPKKYVSNPEPPFPAVLTCSHVPLVSLRRPSRPTTKICSRIAFSAWMAKCSSSEATSGD